MTQLLLTILAHTLADFPCQTQRTISGKGRLKLSAYFIHGLVLFTLGLLFLHGYQLAPALLYLFCITGVHLFIDFLKGSMIRETGGKLQLIGFIIDQIVHLIAIVVLWRQFDLKPNPAVVSWYQTILLPDVMAGTSQEFLFQAGTFAEKLLVGAIIYTAVCFGGAVLIRMIFETYDCGKISEQFSLNGFSNVGAFIGILERLIILTLVYNKSLVSVAFVMTAKSIARFNEMNDKSFAEYYLMGTLLSVGLAVTGGFLLSWLVEVIG